MLTSHHEEKRAGARQRALRARHAALSDRRAVIGGRAETRTSADDARARGRSRARARVRPSARSSYSASAASVRGCCSLRPPSSNYLRLRRAAARPREHGAGDLGDRARALPRDDDRERARVSSGSASTSTRSSPARAALVDLVEPAHAARRAGARRRERALPVYWLARKHLGSRARRGRTSRSRISSIRRRSSTRSPRRDSTRSASRFR